MKIKTAALALSACVLSSCSRPAPLPPQPPYNLTLDMKELMGHVVDPGAWVFWRASGTVDTEHGEESLTPKTAEQWLAAESGAAEVAEAGNLLMIPGRARDGGDFVKFAQELTKDGLDGKAAAEAHDPKKMFESGAAIYQVCTACHAEYVMPFLPKETRKMPGLPAWPEDTLRKQQAYEASKTR